MKHNEAIELGNKNLHADVSSMYKSGDQLKTAKRIIWNIWF